MKKIMILSDTHLNKNRIKFPQIVLDYIVQADYIIHAGDFQSYEVWEKLNEYRPVYGVYGNNDDIRLVQQLPRKTIIQIEAVKIGLIHGQGFKLTTEQRAYDEFKDENVDVVVFGHSHKPYLHKENNILMFNPGSAIQKRFQPQYSFGFMEIEHDQYTLKHIYFNEK